MDWNVEMDFQEYVILFTLYKDGLKKNNLLINSHKKKRK